MEPSPLPTGSPEHMFAEAVRRQRGGDLATARGLYLDLVDQPVFTARCLHQLGLVAADQGDHGRAAALFQQALRVDAALMPAHANLAAARDHCGDAAGAAAALLDLGAALVALGQRDEAAQVFHRILAREPLHYAAAINLGTCLAWQGRTGPAAQWLGRGLTLYGRAMPEIGVFMAGLQQRLGAVLLPEDLPPGPPAGPLDRIEEALTTLGKVLAELALPGEALACHRLVVDLAPGHALGHWNLALALLARGDFVGGWREYEWRWRWPGFPEPRRLLPVPAWRGEAPAGKRILVWTEQGYGDAIQFLPLADRLARLGAEVTVEAPEPLVRLFAANLPGIAVVARPDQPHLLSTESPQDYAVPLMSLPYRLGVKTAALPLATSYLAPPPAAAAAWLGRLGDRGRPRVGMVWAGRAEHAEDAKRSLPADAMRALIAEDGVAWYSLQVGRRQQDLADNLSVVDLAPHLTDFAATATAIASFDLVIAVDTAVAHLAAAMGRPTWLLLPHVADWRWGMAGPSTPWYPSMRLFRQSRPGDWNGVIAAVREALEGVKTGAER